MYNKAMVSFIVIIFLKELVYDISLEHDGAYGMGNHPNLYWVYDYLYPKAKQTGLITTK
ncbi:hypothetical protein ACYATO_06380 [Lactobacillaceae bacterium Melli_B3]